MTLIRQVVMTAARCGARSSPKNVRLIHPYSDCSNPTRPGILPGADPFLVRFRTQAVASVTATLASAIESTIESRVSRLLGDFIEKTSGA